MIGDAAAELALTALETVGVAPEKRPILTHCQVKIRKIVITVHSMNDYGFV